MATGILRYDRMVEGALRGVLRDALRQSENGLPGDHHFYITFRTRHPGVAIPTYIVERYPEEMTIVLQHQYWGLEVKDEWFEVTLSFNRVNERLHVPFAAVTAFADPSVKFGLQFQAEGTAEGEVRQQNEPAATRAETPAAGQGAGQGDGQGARVIALDSFRKK